MSCPPSDATVASVADHYERWPFPGVDHDSREGMALLRRLSRWLPSTGDGPTGRVLDVGCGTGHTTVALARHLPRVRLVGIDLSSAALEIARAHADAAGVDHIHFVQADASALPSELGVFDVILGLGVLHHMPAPDRALARLLPHLVEGGRLVLWLYGRHGRAAHALNQRLLTLLLGPDATDDDRVAAASALLKEGDGRFVVQSGVYTPRGSGPEGVQWLLQHPAWLADQMFPAYECPVTLDEIFTLFDTHGLEFEHWFGVPKDVSGLIQSSELRRRVDRLTGRERLLALECLLRPSYYLVSGRRMPAVARGSP